MKYLNGEEKAIFEAVWLWIIDHSDIAPDGQLFIKAHIKHKDSFRRSIQFRMKGKYRNVLDVDRIMKERYSEHVKKSIENNIKLVTELNRKIIKKTIWQQIKEIFKF